MASAWVVPPPAVTRKEWSASGIGTTRAVTSAVGIWIGTYAYLHATGRRSRIALAALVLLLTVMGAGARADAAVYAAFGAVLAVVLSWGRIRLRPLPLALPIVVILVSIALFFSASQSGGLGYRENDDPALVLIAASALIAAWGGIALRRTRAQHPQWPWEKRGE